jgi:hypothetical protein
MGGGGEGLGGTAAGLRGTWGRVGPEGGEWGGDGRRMGPLPLWVQAGCRCDRHAEWVTVT